LRSALLRIERLVDAIDLLLQQHVAALDPRDALVIGGLEFLERVAQFVVVLARVDWR
jgi:ABC-type uncharacterized transport system ATPase component